MPNWLRSLFGTKKPTGASEVALDATYRVGDRTRDGRKVYLPDGPPNDSSPQWTGGLFPPPGYVSPKPENGMSATVVSGDVLKRAKVVRVSGDTVQVRTEYQSAKRLTEYTRRKNGVYREKGLDGSTASFLVFGLSESNLKSHKLWYTDEEIESGWVIN